MRRVGRRVNHFVECALGGSDHRPSRLSPTRPRVHGVGSNTVALSALVHGYSGKPDLAKMVNAFYLQIAGLRTSVYFDYVPSKANIADLPSRGAVHELLHELRGVPLAARARTDLRVPHVGHWAAPLESWVLRFLHLNGTWPA